MAAHLWRGPGSARAALRPGHWVVEGRAIIAGRGGRHEGAERQANASAPFGGSLTGAATATARPPRARTAATAQTARPEGARAGFRFILALMARSAALFTSDGLATRYPSTSGRDAPPPQLSPAAATPPLPPRARARSQRKLFLLFGGEFAAAVARRRLARGADASGRRSAEVRAPRRGGGAAGLAPSRRRLRPRVGASSHLVPPRRQACTHARTHARTSPPREEKALESAHIPPLFDAAGVGVNFREPISRYVRGLGPRDAPRNPAQVGKWTRGRRAAPAGRVPVLPGASGANRRPGGAPGSAIMRRVAPPKLEAENQAAAPAEGPPRPRGPPGPAAVEMSLLEDLERARPRRALSAGTRVWGLGRLLQTAKSNCLLLARRFAADTRARPTEQDAGSAVSLPAVSRL